ncbi:MAG: FAD-binding oxidoreductase [Anaerolineales bacterium]|nr:FAD-binding oxidoreductase [Anaerolineales bacterium]
MTSQLPLDRLERVEAWGGASEAMCYVYRPTTVEGLRGVFALAREAGVSVGLRGAGYSYGDAPLNAERLLIDLSRMNRILEWDPDRGVITVEPGVTIARLWRYALGDGWWPAVVPGTMFPTVGGCLGMNVHGKNNWNAGTFGEHVLEFEALLPSGELVTCRPDHNEELFYSMIGGLGLLGCFTRITLQLHRVHSGNLEVRSLTEPNLVDLIDRMEALKDEADYLVGWVDGLARGRSLGRGQIHTASYQGPDDDPAPAQSLRLEHQDLSETFFGLIPKSILWRLMRPFMNNLGVRWINRARYWSARSQGDHSFVQSLAAFNFLLDYVPGWKRAYQPEGLVQFQCFLPLDTAADTIENLLQLTHARGLPSYLVVVKRHRPDEFLLSHGLNGFSLAMDFRVTQRNRPRLAELFKEMEELVLESDGRFYFAKDSALRPETARAYLGEAALVEYAALKQRCDPLGLLQTNLARRALPDLVAYRDPGSSAELTEPAVAASEMSESGWDG